MACGVAGDGVSSILGATVLNDGVTCSLGAPRIFGLRWRETIAVRLISASFLFCRFSFPKEKRHQKPWQMFGPTKNLTSRPDEIGTGLTSWLMKAT
jgi:hypothetical protein